MRDLIVPVVRFKALLMAWIVAFISQKGGVGKSTKARALAREATPGGIKTKVADLDTEQATSADWHRRRLAAGLSPAASIEIFPTASQALSAAEGKEGIPKSKLVFALSRIGADAEEAEARHYLNEAGYEVLDGCLIERPAYGQAQNAGLTVTETRYKGLNARADELIQSLINKMGCEYG